MRIDRQLDWQPEGARPRRPGALGAFRCRSKNEKSGGVWMKAPSYETDAQRIIQDYLPKIIDDPRQIVRLGWNGDELLSVVNVDATDPAFMYLRVIGVQTEHRGNKLGYEAFNVALESCDRAAAAAGLSDYALFAKVHPKNAGSQKILTRGGMVATSEYDGDLQYWKAIYKV